MRSSTDAEADGLIAQFNPATHPDPENPVVWANYGVGLVGARRYAEALPWFEKAFRADASGVNAANLSQCLAHSDRLDEAEALAAHALRLDAKLGPAWAAAGHVYRRRAQWQQSRRAYENAAALCPEDAQYRYNVGILDLTLGDWDRGWRLYEERLKFIKRHVWPYPYWDGRPVKRLLVTADEQGFGDAIMFFRFFHLAARLAQEVVLAAPMEIANLFRKNLPDFPGKSITVYPVSLGSSLQVPGGADAWVSLASLPFLLGFTDSLSSLYSYYLRADSPFKRDELPKSRLIGYCNAGSPGHIEDRLRSIPHDTMMEDALRWSYNRLFNLSERQFCCFSATAAFIETLDLVITVDTAVAHLAGAMGKPTWLLLPLAHDFRWGTGDECLWYPSVRYFRQQDLSGWGPVLERVREELMRG